MFTLLPGVLGFLIFYLYDINSVTKNKPLLRFGFSAGFALLVASTVAVLLCSAGQAAFHPVFLFFAAVFFALEIYTLFFALPFTDTYISPKEKPPVCRTGMYALCRHPGVLWFSLGYASLWGLLPCSLTLAAFLLFSLLDLVYIILQDLWIFPLTFRDYEDYRQDVPFLIPTPRSIRRAAQTFSLRKEGSHENR